MNNKTKEMIIVFSPLILGIIEFFHPVGSSNQTPFQAIAPQVNLWITIHVLQIPLFGLMALSLILMTQNLRGRAVTISKIGVGFFIIFYPVIDSIAGIAGGLLIQNAAKLSPSAQAFMSKQINVLFFDPIVGGSTFSLFAVLGTLGWLVAVLGAAWALLKASVSRVAVIFLFLAAIFFGLSHVPPTGPLGLGCFFIAVMIIDFPVLDKKLNQ